MILLNTNYKAFSSLALFSLMILGYQLPTTDPDPGLPLGT